MNAQLQKEEEQEPLRIIQQLAGGAPSKPPAMLRALDIDVPSAIQYKRWTRDIEIEYDPKLDLFIDTKTKHAIFAPIDGEYDESFFNTDVEIDSLKFESDNSEWIKMGGGARLKLEEILGLKREKNNA